MQQYFKKGNLEKIIGENIIIFDKDLKSVKQDLKM